MLVSTFKNNDGPGYFFPPGSSLMKINDFLHASNSASHFGCF